MTDSPEALAAVLDFKRAQLIAAAERVAPIADVAGGLAVFTPSLPRVWELNLVLAPTGADRETIERLLEAAEQLQGAAGLRHRKLRLSGPAAADDSLDALAGAAGWTFERELVMVRRRPPDGRPAVRADVREISADELAPAEDQFLMSEPYGRDPAIRRQLIAQHERWQRGATVARRIAIFEGERAVAWCRLYDHHGITEIDGVGVVPDRRGSGLGRALLHNVLARVPDDRVLFLCADTDDWPKALYGKLGFDAVGERLGATKASAG
jgi:ribosomal protein S18 acetylase RimI-like enzyme